MIDTESCEKARVIPVTFNSNRNRNLPTLYIGSCYIILTRVLVLRIDLDVVGEEIYHGDALNYLILHGNEELLLLLLDRGGREGPLAGVGRETARSRVQGWPGCHHWRRVFGNKRAVGVKFRSGSCGEGRGRWGLRDGSTDWSWFDVTLGRYII